MSELPIILILAFAVLAPVGVGVAYFQKTPAGSLLWRRLVASAYTPSIGLIFVFVGTFWPEGYQYNAHGARLLWQLQLIPLVLLGASLVLYPGPRKLHFFLVPTSFALWVWIFGMSWISVHGK